ncbi:thiamine-monophosphate kinase [archaeon BMS3Abin16]|nr:thiamine-monophosphate kinase [archaeon BMS3Abin16]
MKLADLGEQGVIELFKREFETLECASVLKSIGDDCAVIRLDGGDCLVVSIDTILQKTHIPREMTPEQIGIYAVNVVLSDIAAMGAEPLGLVFSTALPQDMNRDFAGSIAKGMAQAAAKHGTSIVGGDTQKAEEIAITGTAFGRVKEENLLLRSGAGVGDLICTTGEIGSAAAGFYCLTNKIDGYHGFIKRALEPRARLREGKILSKFASSCMDISDGLALSVHEIATQSGVGARIFEEKIPINHRLNEVARLTGVSLREMTLYKGGDFELLFTVAPDRFESVRTDMEKIGSPAAAIGEITEKNIRLVDEKGCETELAMRGWQAFS